MSDAGNGGGGAASSSATAVLKKPLLKPPRFGSSSASSASSTAFTMSAAKLQFPGFKESKLGDSVAKLGAAPATASSAPSSSTAAATDSPSTTTLGFIPLTKDKPAEPSANNSTTKSDSSSAEAKATDNGSSAVNAPTSSASVSATAAASSSTTFQRSSSFVFGQRLDDRVENVQKTEESAKPEDKPAEEALETGKPSSDEQEAPEEKKPGGSGKTLSEAAAEYCESHQAQKRRYEEITPVTGEENERNVAQINAKLYVFDKAGSSWTEKGRGCLRLNDDVSGESGGGSRVVMRREGTLRVILNTKLFAGMSVESPSEKNIRMTGMDGEGQARIFLIGGSAKDIGRLFALMKERTSAAPAAAASSSSSENGDDAAKRPKVQEDDA